MRRLGMSGCLLLATLSPALAHPGHGDAAGFLHGLSHPLSGVDHLLAMVAVGILAARLGGRAMLLVPLTFVASMAAAGAYGAAGLPLPYVEVGIALSVLVLGVAIATGVALPVAAAAGLAGVFAVFHGYAHGAEMPDTASGFAFGLGFVLATALLHGLGITIGLAARALPQWASRVGGSALALAGAALLVGAV